MLKIVLNAANTSYGGNDMADKKRFAFVIHPRDKFDVGRRRWWEFTRLLPERLVEQLILTQRGDGPFTLCSSFTLGSNVEGFIVTVPLTARQMITLPSTFVRNRILETVRYAQNRLEASWIGLGAFTSSVTDGGKWLKRQGITAIMTHGDTYAVVATLQSIKKLMEPTARPTTAILGATGIIGSALSKILAQENYPLILVGRNQNKLAKLGESIGKNGSVFCTIDLREMRAADLVVTVTSHPGSLVEPHHLKRGAVVLDVAQPSNVSADIVTKRPDVTRLDSPHITLPLGVNLGFNMGPPSGTTFPCLAETALMTLTGSIENQVGKISLDHLQTIQKWAQKYGFTLAPFTSFGKPGSVQGVQLKGMQVTPLETTKEAS